LPLLLLLLLLLAALRLLLRLLLLLSLLLWQFLESVESRGAGRKAWVMQKRRRTTRMCRRE